MPAPDHGAVPKLPQNGGVVWRYSDGFLPGNTPEPSWFSVQRVDGNNLVDVGAVVTDPGWDDGSVVIKPASEDWVEGARYRISADIPTAAVPRPEHQHGVTEVDIGPPLRAKPSSLEVAGNQVSLLDVADASSCVAKLTAASRQLFIKSQGDPDPIFTYRGSIAVTTLVDGVRWQPRKDACSIDPPGAPWVGRTGIWDLVYADCGGSHGLSEGTHTVQMKLSLPGSNWSYSSNPVPFTLDCSQPPSGLYPLCADIGGGGGGCEVAGDETRGSWFALLALLGLVVVERKRHTGEA